MHLPPGTLVDHAALPVGDAALTAGIFPGENAGIIMRVIRDIATAAIIVLTTMEKPKKSAILTARFVAVMKRNINHQLCRPFGEIPM